MQKRLLMPARVRRVPHQFSWLDQRLVHEHYLERCGLAAWSLYLFLVIVGDAQGLSYYADASVAKRLAVDGATPERARLELLREQLIAYEPPLYQVLALGRPPSPQTAKAACLSSTPSSEPIAIQAHIRRLRQALEGRP